MLTRDYLDFLTEHGGPKYECKPTAAGQESVHMYDAPFMTLMPEMWDYEARIRDMDKAGVDLAIVSLTCPNAYFGDQEISSRAAAMVNDSMAEQQNLRPDRIGWFASLPWQYADARPCGRLSTHAHCPYLCILRRRRAPSIWGSRNMASSRRSVSCSTQVWQSRG